MATLSPPPRFNSESLRGLRSTIEDLRTERETLDRFLDESFQEFEELASGLSAFDEQLQQARTALNQEQQALVEERERLETVAARSLELEKLVASQEQTIAALRDELAQARDAQGKAEQRVAGAVGDIHTAVELVDVVQTWSQELSAVAGRLREHGMAIASRPGLAKKLPQRGAEPDPNSQSPPAATGSRERHPEREAAPAAPTELKPLSSPAQQTNSSSSPPPPEPGKGKRNLSKGSNPLDPVVGSVLAELAELERAADE